MALTRVKGKVLQTSVDTINDLPTTGYVGQAIIVNHYHSDVEGGGGTFIWANEAKSTHNGGTVIDPTAVFPTDWSNQTQLGTWFDTSNAGTGVWKRQYDGAVNVKWFGAKGEGIEDTVAIQKAISVTNTISGALYFPEGTYRYTPTSSFVTTVTGNGFTLLGEQGRSIIETDYNGIVFIFNTQGAEEYFNSKGLIVDGLDFRNVDYDTVNTNATAIYVHRDNTFGANITVNNCNFSRYSYCAIHVIRGYNCRFINTSFSGVAYRDANTFPQIQTEAGIRMWGADGTATSQDHSFSNLCRIENCKFDYLYIGVDIWGSDRTNLITNSTFQASQIGIEIKGNNATSETSTVKAGYGLAVVTVDNCWFELVWMAFVGNLINSGNGLFYAPGAYPTDPTITQGTVTGCLNNYYNTATMVPADALAPIVMYTPVVEGVSGTGTAVKYIYGQDAHRVQYRMYADDFYVSPAATFDSGITVASGGILINSAEAAVLTLTRDGGTATNTVLEARGDGTSWFAGISSTGEYGINYNSADLAAPYFKIDPDSNITMALTTATPALTVNKTFMFELTTNTNLRIHVRGSDGINRSVDLTLA